MPSYQQPLAVLSLLAVLGTSAQADMAFNSARNSLFAFNETFNEYVLNHDAEGLVALYDEGAYWIAPHALPIKGREGVPRQTITFLTKNEGKLTHTIDELFISDDSTQAVMMGVTDGAIPAAGVAFTGTYVYVLRRDGPAGPWRIVLDIFNNHPAD